MADRDIFLEEASKLLRWTKECCLPLWATAAEDPLGGYYESLDHDGHPILNAPKRLRVQARQAFSFARAEHLGWMTGGRTASDEAWQFLLNRGVRKSPEGRPAFVHIFHADGSVADDKIDLYDHAFVLLAASERELRYQDAEATAVSQQIIALIEELRHPNGGFAEGVPTLLPRRTNPHMHLFEACLVRRELGCDFARRTISEIGELWEQHFWDESRGVLREFFTDDWQLDPATGDLVEPGHMMEWLFLLHSAEMLDDALARRIFDQARTLGQHEAEPLLADTFDLGQGARSSGCRLWSQTEHIRAAVTVASRTGDASDWQHAADLIQAFRRLYLEPVVLGGWVDRLDHNGTPVSDKMPTSLLYHIVTAVEAVEKAAADKA